jgi:chain length determinant protein EpsF
MSLSHFLAVLRARAALALLVFAVTVAAAVGVGAMLPRAWKAETALMIDAGRPDPVSGIGVTGLLSAAYLSTQADVIRSERVALEVVRRLGLERDAATLERWQAATQGQGEAVHWIARDLLERLDVRPARDSSVVTLAATASDPALAARVANTFAQAYIDTSVALRADPARQTSAFFETQAREARAQLERAQARLSDFQRDKGVFVSDDRLDIEAARLNELSSQLTALQAVVAESGSRQQQAQGPGADRLQEVLANPLLGSLRTELTRAESRLQELNQRLGENHPQVRETRAQIAVLRSRLDSETARVAGSVGVSNTINRQREAELRQALDVQRGRVAQMRALRDQGQVLLREVENAQRAYDNLLGRLSQTSLESRSTLGAAHVLGQAVPPLRPSSTSLRVLAGLGAALGLVLALVGVLVLEWAEPRLRTVGTATAQLGVPLLGVLPGPGGSARFAARKVPLVAGPLYGRLTGPRRR